MTEQPFRTKYISLCDHSLISVEEHDGAALTEIYTLLGKTFVGENFVTFPWLKESWKYYFNTTVTTKRFNTSKLEDDKTRYQFQQSITTTIEMLDPEDDAQALMDAIEKSVIDASPLFSESRNP